jgi:siroheme synthase-like protein
VEGLLAAEGAVTVVSPTLSDGLRAFHGDGRIRWIDRAYERGDMASFDIVMVADEDQSRNADIYAEGRERKILVNSADDTPNCDFILPAVIRKGQVTIAASTGGTSPALARRLREELAAYLTDEMPALADLLAEVRAEFRARGIAIDGETWQRAIDAPLRVLLAQRRYDEARSRLLTSLGVADAAVSNVQEGA